MLSKHSAIKALHCIDFVKIDAKGRQTFKYFLHLFITFYIVKYVS